MGQVERELKQYTPNSQNAKYVIHKADFAYIDRRSGELTIRDSLVVSEYDGLKDIEYAVIDGILYIKATEVRWKWIAWSGDEFGGTFLNPKYFPITEDHLRELIIPEECIVKNVRHGWFSREPLAIELSKCPNDKWFQLKQEYEFEYCMHPFKIYEKQNKK
jgi:hypothetical protein